jgi:hypothetical protein
MPKVALLNQTGLNIGEIDLADAVTTTGYFIGATRGIDLDLEGGGRASAKQLRAPLTTTLQRIRS